MAAALTAAAMTLGELLGPVAAAHADREISDLVLDSRQVTAGAGFVAVPGSMGHGLDFAAQALERGASIVIYEPSPAHPVVPEPSLAVPGIRDRLGELASVFFGAFVSAVSIERHYLVCPLFALRRFRATRSAGVRPAGAP